jgi:outer membrane protein
MKKVLLVVAISFCVLLSVVSAKSYGAETIKIGIIDLAKALNESEAGKKAKSDLEALIKSKQSLIDEKAKKVENLKSELEKQAALISQEAKKAKEEELEKALRDYQRTVSDAQAEVQKKEGEFTNEILKELRNVINSFAQEESYSIILEKAEGVVLYSSQNMDITDKVIKKYNEMKAKSK